MPAGLTGQEPPGRDTFVPIWNAWNAKDPEAQATDGLRADEATLEQFESLDPGQKTRLRLHLFGMDPDVTGLASLPIRKVIMTMRLRMPGWPSGRVPQRNNRHIPCICEHGGH